MEIEEDAKSNPLSNLKVLLLHHFLTYKSIFFVLITQSIFIYCITLEKTLKTIYSYLKMILHLFNKIYFVTFCIFCALNKTAFICWYSVYQDGTNRSITKLNHGTAYFRIKCYSSILNCP